MKTAKELLEERIAELGKDKGREDTKQTSYISQEFQDYAYRLAVRLDDTKHVPVYMRYVKAVPRAMIDDAAAFATDYPKAKNKGKIFTWKLHQLLAEYKEKHPDFKLPPRARGKRKPRAKTKAKAKAEPKQFHLV